jgi:hypothetical protein
VWGLGHPWWRRACLLRYITSWPEVYRNRQVKPGAPPPGPFDEANAAAALLNLFHRLPVSNPTTVMEQLVNGVLRLELALPAYRSVASGCRRRVGGRVCPISM